ncbi:NAD kinase [Bacteroidales bacterium OttesenSCG-928-K03]|nr:NAD kinase [Odoribacter sp. OttesenSCG-928-L07]MDL2239019.1 NAD kinase [Bacteroidales bacterium OttesenSCG-928-L14]MDL2242143.1 NAD kinase [Bacteroidales bacterium OttesenSCG-928-K03]
MQMIAVYGRELLSQNINFLQKIIDRIENEGYQIMVYSDYYEKINSWINFKTPVAIFHSNIDLNENVKFMFSIGGDGTMLDTAQLIKDSNIPVLGFNLGRMGFLSIIKQDNIDEVLDEIFNGKYIIDERSLIKVSDEINSFDCNNFGLNEVCFLRKNPYSMLSISVWVNNLFLNKYWSDGLIIATPTGSTAYSLSCSGPILDPHVNSFVLSPIASHNLTVGPIVIPDDSVIKVNVSCRDSEFCVNIDSISRTFNSGSEFIIKKNDFKFKLIQPQSINFFNTLRNKLNWGIDVRN